MAGSPARSRRRRRWDEDSTARHARRALAAMGATPYRLAPPDGAGDWNDRLQAVGLAAMRAELDAAICGALAPRP
ncbi:MAG TPA: hypothetical protein VIJ07_21310 [Dermatophilaceae bacterium]